MDPYVELSLSGEKYKTPVAKNQDQAPKYGQSFIL
jgi:hypothetical protein